MASISAPGSAAAAAVRNVSRMRAFETSLHCRNSSRLVLNSRKRYGCEMPASRAIASVLVPW